MAASTTKLGVGVALLAAVLGIGVYAGVRYLFFGLDEATPWDKPATVQGSTIELTYDGRECRDRLQVEVEEDATSVVVTVNETVRSLVCGDDEPLESFEVTVELESPLGERSLVDGACRLGQFGEDPRCGDDVTAVIAPSPAGDGATAAQ
ncbi:hypothetical protein [Nocardioides sp.]|uniref:hypothetical protein n=1 Tax=Nocardioides sp. TaxID=35761 RepID=UPI000C8E0A34|nr:hypothetical protein [Nocardioides sp.]MAS55326.1 hypothetical protein [Pimelobacter sp.]MDE0778453.1 hypothetical protein [Nocardioides sp.]